MGGIWGATIGRGSQPDQIIQCAASQEQTPCVELRTQCHKVFFLPNEANEVMDFGLFNNVQHSLCFWNQAF